MVVCDALYLRVKITSTVSLSRAPFRYRFLDTPTHCRAQVSTPGECDNGKEDVVNTSMDAALSSMVVANQNVSNVEESISLALELRISIRIFVLGQVMW